MALSSKDQKTVQSAVILMPPQELWEPIQKIREVHDKVTLTEV